MDEERYDTPGKRLTELERGLDRERYEYAKLCQMYDDLEDERDELRTQLARTEEEMQLEIDRTKDERDRLREALTPSEATKWAYMSEFVFRFGDRTVNVPWTTIKEIMYAIQDRADSIGAK